LNDGAALADALRADLAADLATYDIRDTSTLRSYYRALSTIAMLQHHPDDALAYEEKARALEEKPAARLYQVLCSGRWWRRKRRVPAARRRRSRRPSPRSCDDCPTIRCRHDLHRI